jgi:hypothetical protein
MLCEAPIDPMHVGQVIFNPCVFLHVCGKELVQTIILLLPDLRCKVTSKHINHRVWIKMLVIFLEARFHGSQHPSLYSNGYVTSLAILFAILCSCIGAGASSSGSFIIQRRSLCRRTFLKCWYHLGKFDPSTLRLSPNKKQPTSR